MFAAPAGERRLALRQAVEAVEPFNMAAAFDSQPWNARIGSQHIDFIFKRHQRNNIVHALFHALSSDPEMDSFAGPFEVSRTPMPRKLHTTPQQL